MSTSHAVRARESKSSARPLHLVRTRSRRLIGGASARRRAPVIIAGLICVVAVIFGVLLEQVMLAQSAFKVEKLRAGMTAAQKHHEELMLEAARLGSPDRIEHYARTYLGMVEPASVEYIVANIGTETHVAELRWRGRQAQVATGADAAAVDAERAP